MKLCKVFFKFFLKFSFSYIYVAITIHNSDTLPKKFLIKFEFIKNIFKFVVLIIKKKFSIPFKVKKFKKN